MTERSVNPSQPPVFEPWIGKNFSDRSSNRFRLLVLGESHYATEDHAQPGITKWVVEHHMKSEPREPFFTKWSQLLANRGPFASISAVGIFDEVAFYNFVQRLVGIRHDDRPTEDDWKDACPRFLNVLDVCRPHAVLVLGMETWNHIRFPDNTRSEVAVSDRQRTWTRPDGWKVAATSINHPQARGWRASDWQPMVDELLQRGLASVR